MQIPAMVLLERPHWTKRLEKCCIDPLSRQGETGSVRTRLLVEFAGLLPASKQPFAQFPRQRGPLFG